MIPVHLRRGCRAGIWMLVVLLCGTASCQRKVRLTGPSPDGSIAEASKTGKASGDEGVDRLSVSEPGTGPSSSNSAEGQKQQPNWIGDPRYVRAKNPAPVQGSGGTGTGRLEQPVGKAGDMTVGGAPPVAPAMPTVPANSDAVRPVTPVRQAVTQADMQEVWIYMENASAVSGRLPPPAEVYAALVQTQAKAAELVRNGAIILTGAKNRESVWAFETAALQHGGWVAGPSGVENVSASELKRRLGQAR